MNENQEIKPTSKSHLKALVKAGREKAQRAAVEKARAADERDRAERAIRRRQRQGSNYDPSEDDLEDSYNPQGNFVSEEDEGMDPKVKAAGERIKAALRKKTGKGNRARGGTDSVHYKITAGDEPEDAEARRGLRMDSYDPTLEFADNVMREAFDKMTPGELKDYDSKSLKPGSQGGHRRSSTPEERDEYAKRFRKSRGYASQKVKKLRDLDYKKNR